MPHLRRPAKPADKIVSLLFGGSVPVLLYAGHVSRLHELSASAARKARITIKPSFFILPAINSTQK